MSRKISNKGYVYMITSPNNRVYIGSTVNFKERFSSYRRMENKAQIKLFNSFNKYGVENHLFEVIWIGDKNQMRKYEAIIGNNFNVIDRGLNCCLPKINEEYKCASDETRDKIEW